jgi:hypothetical protein
MSRVILLLFSSLLFFSSQAQSITGTNARPVPINNSGNNGEPTLSSILNGPAGLFPDTPIDVASGQSTAGLWRSASSIATMIPTLVVEYAGYAPINKFGIWFGTDASRLWTLDLLLGAATPRTFSAISIGDGILQAAGLACSTQVSCGTFTDSRITPKSFGFYFQTGDGPRVYSLDALNADKEARFLAYQAGSTTNWAFAYEDIPLRAGSDRDYNDMVIKMESLVPVPEPMTWALMLAGLVALAVGRRYRLLSAG